MWYFSFLLVKEAWSSGGVNESGPELLASLYEQFWERNPLGMMRVFQTS